MTIRANDVLELERIRQALAERAETPNGKARALSLIAWTEREHVARALEETSEARQLHDDNETVRLDGCPEIDSIIERLGIEGRASTLEELIALARFCRISTLVRTTLATQQDTIPLIGDTASRIPKLGAVETRITRVIDLDAEEVRDDASEKLRKLRAGSSRIKKRLQRVLETALAARGNLKLLQEAIVTTRNGRSVIPVKAECKSQFPGIVHGASSSGATVFVEPMAAVEPGNELAAISDQERQEVRRIIEETTAAIRPERKSLEEAGYLVTEIDFAQAKGRLSASFAGHAPELSESSLRLVEARHPLVSGAVPISFHLSSGRHGLIFSGPNTGGKTVALKTAGLLSLMAQAGLHIPASSETVLPVFRTIFADIGDDQSIAANLSTFSAHLEKVVSMTRELSLPALVILDEVGTGTDPAEGGALGTAVVEHFLEKGALVIASTHHGLLKAYASTTEGVDTASFQFDPETYEPTFEIIEGASGRSLAFEVALRLGLPKSIVDRARALQSERERQVSQLVERLEADTALVEEQKQELEGERARASALRTQLEAEARDERMKRVERLSDFRDSLDQEIDETRQELRALLGEARRARLEQTQRLDELEKNLSRRLDEATRPRRERAASEVRRLAPELESKTERLESGARVIVASFGVEGRIARIVSPHEAEVIVNDKKLRLPLEGLEPLPARPDTKPARVPESHGLELKTSPSELNVIGCTVEEALDLADKFLDDACLSDHREVRLIHGHGTGRLKSAIREWLTSHPHVAKQKSENQGGVTLVELKD